MNIYLDIETIPTQRPEERARIYESVHPPNNISKPETLEKWWTEKAPAVQEKAWRDTALSGTWGEIVVISFCADSQHVASLYSGPGMSERDILHTAFMGISAACKGQLPHYIGHNVGFDLRILYQRAVVNNVKPPHLPYNAKPWSGRYTDTMYEWAGQGGYIGLSELCRALGIESDDTMTGAEVWDAWQAGEYDKVREHARADVERARSVYRKLNFGSAPDAATGLSRHSTTTPAMGSASGD